MPFKIKLFIITILLTSITLFLASNTLASEEKKVRGYRGPIGKEVLNSKLKEIHDKEGEWVEGYVIEGKDIISIIEKTDIDIRIKNSIIKGGLDFIKLPKVQLDRLKLPDGWSKDEKEKWRMKQTKDKPFCQVTNKILIINSDIQSARSQNERFLVNATRTFFSGEVDFSDATFSGVAFFSDATFSGMANFSAATFSGMAFFSDATFSGEVDFSDATFSGVAFFSAATFSEKANFSYATFSGLANFSYATFNGVANFSYATFNGVAAFFRASFMKLADFNRSKFLSSLSFRNVDFREYADLRNTQIRRLDCNSVDSPTIIKGRLDFRNTIISEAHIQDFIFEKNVYFSDSKFGVLVEEEKKESVSNTDKKPDKRNMKVKSSLATVFRFLTFESHADFKRTKFLGNTAFENVNFIQDANFTDVDFKARKDGNKQKFSLSYLNFKNLFIKWDQLPNIRCWVTGSSGRIKSFVEIKEEEQKKLEPLSHVFKSFEANFRAINQLSDANQAYYHRKKAELKETKNGDDSWLTTQREAEWIFLGIPCGYGTKIYWIIGWSVLITLLFAVVYSIKGELNRLPHPETKQEFKFKQRLFDFPKKYCSKNSKEEVKNHKFINALRFSAVILFKVGYRDTTISGKILGIDYTYIVWLEWALGYYILGALVVTLSNTLPIVNRLITGVF